MNSTNPDVTIVGMEPNEAEVLAHLQRLGHPLVSVTLIHCRSKNAVTDTVTPDELPDLAQRIVARKPQGLELLRPRRRTPQHLPRGG